jgi:hypothetical protein
MEAIHTFDSDFKYDNSKKYLLVLQTGSDAMVYAVYDIADKKYIGLNYLPFNSLTETQINDYIKKTLEEDPLLSNNFSEVVFQHLSFRVMLVPESLFDSKNLRAFLKFHYDVDEKDYIHFQELKSAEAFVIFTVPSQIEELLCSKYPKVKFSHHTIPFIHNALNRNDNNENSRVLNIYFATDFFDIMIVRDHKIQLFNSFYYEKYTDVLFFLANILNLFSIKPDNTKINISGNLQKVSELKNELKRMFKIIDFDKFNPSFNYSSKLTSLEQHRFANLLNLYPCEL